MKKTAELILFFPALVFWVFFAPSFRFANYLSTKFNISQSKTSLWFWCNIEAKDHESFYRDYDEETF